MTMTTTDKAVLAVLALMLVFSLIASLSSGCSSIPVRVESPQMVVEVDEERASVELKARLDVDPRVVALMRMAGFQGDLSFEASATVDIESGAFCGDVTMLGIELDIIEPCEGSQSRRE